MNVEPVKIAISTCPNDTFAFHGLLTGRVACPIPYEIQLLDIQQLNDGLFADQFDIAKASFHAALLLADKTVVLPSGSALGFGVGPLLLAAQPDSDPSAAGMMTLCPGRHTTATLLFKMFYGLDTRIEHQLFSEIMPLLQRSEADFGVCIHEGRFTWEEQGLYLVEDLGDRWEKETNSPLPLGGILASRGLAPEVIECVQNSIRDSIEYGHQNRSETLESMRKYAQEFDDDVLFQHVDLYVNQWTTELGLEGKQALNQLSEKARGIGVVSAGISPISIWDRPS